LDNITLNLGDCLDYLPSIETASVDAVITDPPYGQTAFDWDKPMDMKKWWPEIRRICKPTAMVIMFGAQPFVTDLINSNRKEFRYELIWCKTRGTGFLDANKRPLRAHENILFFSQRWRGPKNVRVCTYNPQWTWGKPYKASAGKDRAAHYGSVREVSRINCDGHRHPLSWQLVQNSNYHSKHPTKKPEDLMRWLIRSYTNPDDLILDSFMGSGTTGIAAIKENRRFIGCEKEPGYFEIAKDQILQAQEI
jgi:site-specific DNA-methyltransferase (adenine-specific)